ncbi:UreE urease accessory domain protein [Shewanella halifaxensis HAW-EB4]|uniref:Urease accessory protein UreE n=1 Tax=Shewanella halifaxensis (strain HAW-EB4) TaxID=458817 RepID=UREE_SHEHH|nr:urease accessory protein UreE [Shewanella halifaxensis]B0TT72.1 RecName: Full=Urease accessory protein UreE [Shewanella halifaxensis HAW-EB4]ABZ78013.1 UreE urease accessory domain protein [Shewanella halifaxensis HAW-EB4]
MIKLTQILTEVPSVDAKVCLTMVQRTKSRLRIVLEDGQDAGLLLPRGHILHHGSLLSTDDGFVVEVVAAKEQVSTARSDNPTLFAKGCYHLGNRHVPLQVEAGWCRYQHDYVLDEMLIGLGLQVTVENEAFQPEAGAYGGTTGGHSHGDAYDDSLEKASHEHAHGHPHKHEH